MLGDIGLVVNPKSGANLAMAGFGGAACAVAAMLVLFWVASPVLAQGAPCTSQESAFPIGSGSGTLADPYEVRTRCQLQAMGANREALTRHYVLMNTIEAARTVNWNVEAGRARGFVPIASGIDGEFEGSFVNGANHVIRDLYIYRPNTDNVGLFASLGATGKIQGVVLVNSMTVGRYQVGSLVGVSKGTIEDCSILSLQGQSAVSAGSFNVDGSLLSKVGGLVGKNRLGGSISNSLAQVNVDGADEVAGGLVGENFGSISSSTATGSVIVRGGGKVGGLVGDNQRVGPGEDAASIHNSHASGSVKGRARGIGGLVGINRTGASVSNSSAAGNVTQDDVNGVGGLVGENYGSISNSRALGRVAGLGESGGLVGRNGGSVKNSYATGAVMGSADGVGGLVGRNGAGVSVSDSYATGNVEGTNNNVGGLVGNNYGSISNGRAEASLTRGNNNVGGLVGSNQPGAKVSDSSYAAAGGAAGRITGSDRVGGLVGDNHGSISGSSAVADVTGDVGDVGGLVGRNRAGASVSNSSAEAKVEGSNLDSSVSVDNVGGLVGINHGSISGSTAMGTVTGDRYVGGLAGYNEAGVVEESHAVADVRGSSKDVGGSRKFAGGLLGYNGGTVRYNSATGSVFGDGSRVGGLVGHNSGRINDSYATGTVEGKTNVGGLVGYYANVVGVPTVGGAILNSYATGWVLGSENVGGLVGGNDARPGKIIKCFATGSAWLVSGSGNLGGLVGYQTPDTNERFDYNYYARGPDDNTLGRLRTFDQLRCPTRKGDSCLLPSGGMRTYREWNESATVWNFGNDRQLPQLEDNPNPDLNVKPYISGSTEMPFRVSPGDDISSLSLAADYAGDSSQGPVTLTWSLPGLPDRLSGLVYFSSADGSAGPTASGGSVTLSATGESLEAVSDGSFYVALNNGVSDNDDRIRVRIVPADRPSIGGPAKLILGAGEGDSGYQTLSLEQSYRGPAGMNLVLKWSLEDLPEALRGSVHFLATGFTTTTEVSGDIANLVVNLSAAQLASYPDKSVDFGVVLKNGVGSDDGDRLSIQVVDARLPTFNPAVRKVPVGTVPGKSRLSLEAMSPGYRGESLVLTWSLSGLPSALTDLVYFDLGDGATGPEATGPEATGQNVELVVVRDGRLPVLPAEFPVELGNNLLPDETVSLTIQIVSATELPEVTLSEGDIPAAADGSEVATLNRRIPVESVSKVFAFEATDFYGGDFGDLSWSLVDKNLASGADVVFSSATRGGVVELKVTRSLTLHDVGSFMLGITSGTGAYVEVRVVVVTGCSEVQGDDLMSDQPGNGTPDNPYQIKGLCQLQDMRSDLTADYILVAHIDAIPTRNWNGGKGFEPIASGTLAGRGFRGSFVNDSSYMITDLTIKRPNTDNVALFSRLENEAMIKGVVLVDSRITGGDHVGSLVGSGSGTIENSRSSGWVSGRNGVGGLVGTKSAVASVSYSSAAGKVSGQDGVGGLVGSNAGNIRNNYAVATVSGGVNVGGLVGSHSGNAVISDNYATGWVLGNKNVGGLVGNNRSSREIRNSYATGSVWGDSSVGGLAGQSEGSTSLNSYYARGPDNGLGAKRSFDQLRCPTQPGPDCRLGDVLTYKDWGVSAWDFGNADAAELPQLRSNSNRDLNVKPYISGPAELPILVDPVQGFGSLPLGVDYVGAEPLTWSLVGLPTTLEGLVYFSLAGDRPSPTASGSAATLSAMIERMELVAGTSFYVVLMNNASPNGDRVRIRIVEALRPSIVGPDERTVAVADGVSGFSSLVFEVDGAGSSEEFITWTWSLPELPTALTDLVYFDSGGDTTGTTVNGLTANLVVVRSEMLPVPASFKVLLMNDVSTRSDSVQILIERATPPVIGEGGTSTEDGGQIRTIWEGAIESTLTVAARDPDGGDPDDLSWMIENTDGLAPGASVKFSGSTMGGVVELTVTRPLDLYDVGSFVLRVTSGSGAHTTVTISIVARCSEVRGRDLMSGQTGDGGRENPYQIKGLCQLQDIRSDLTAHYELVADIDASPTATWNGGAGFEPIALGTFTGGGFRGSFVNNDNYVITALTINRPNRSNVALFSRLDTKTTIRGVILTDSDVVGGSLYVGSLVGLSQGMIQDCSVTGSVSGNDNVGGLAGRNRTGATIDNSHMTGLVSGKNNVGGLAGDNYGNILNSRATASVSGEEDDVGGLVGSNRTSANIISSFATGLVSGKDNVGGLVGGSEGRVSGSYAVASVSGNRSVGGLIGVCAFSNIDDIENNYATGWVLGNNRVGGLVGFSLFCPNINSSYATGSVWGESNVGGLVGESDGSGAILNSYYARGPEDNTLGILRTFQQLRCPTVPGEDCSLGDEPAYEGWNAGAADVWDFGTAADLPQLQANRNPDLNVRPYIRGRVERLVEVGPAQDFSLAFEADHVGTEPLTWSLAGLPDELSGFVYFSLANGTTATTATGSNTTLSVKSDGTQLGVGEDFYVVLMNDASVNGDRVRIRVVERGQPSIAGPDERRAAVGNGVSGFSNLVLSADHEGPQGEPVTLTWSLPELPTTLQGFVYFSLANGTTAKTATGSNTTLSVTRNADRLMDGMSFDVVLKNGVGFDDGDSIQVEAVDAAQATISGSTERVVLEGTIPVNASLDFKVAIAGHGEQSAILTWSLSELPPTLADLVYFEPGRGTSTGIETTGRSVNLVVARHAEFPVPVSFDVLLMNDVSVYAPARVQVRVVEAGQPFIADPGKRTVAVGNGVSGFSNLAFEAEDTEPSEESITWTWSLSGLPDELSSFVYFSLANGTTATTATGGNTTLSVTRNADRLADETSFEVVLMNGVSTSRDSVQVQAVNAVQATIAGEAGRVVLEGTIPVNASLDFKVENAGDTGEDVTLTWSLSELPSTLRGLVYFDPGRGTSTGIETTGRSANLVVARGAGFPVPASFYVLLMNNVSVYAADRVGVRVVEEGQPVIAGPEERTAVVGNGVSGFSNLAFEVVDTDPSEESITWSWSLPGLPDELSSFVYFSLANGTTATTATGSNTTLSVTRDANDLAAGTSFEVVLMNGVSTSRDSVQVRVVEEGQPVIAGLGERTVVVGNGVSGFSNLVFTAVDTGSPEESITWAWSLPELPGTLQGLVYFSLAGGTTATTATGSNTTLSVTRNADRLAAGTSFEVVLMNDVSASRDSVRVQAVDAAQATISGSTERVVLEGTIPVNANLVFEVENAGYGEASATLTWSLSELPSSLVGLVYFDPGRGTSTGIETTGSSAKLVVARHTGFPVPASFDVLLMNDVSVYAPARVRVRVVEEGQPVIAGPDGRIAAVGNGVSGFSNLVFEADDAEPSEESITWTWSLPELPDELSGFVYFSLADGTTATTATGGNTTLSVTRNADRLADGAGFEVVLMNGVSTSRDSVQVRAVDAMQATIAGAAERVVLEGRISVNANLVFEAEDAGYGGESAILTWSLSELPSSLVGLVYFDLGGGTTRTTAGGSSAKLVVAKHEAFPVPVSFDVLLTNDVSVYAPAQVQVRVVEEGQPVIAGSDERTAAVGNGVSGFSSLAFEIVHTERPGESITWTWSLSGLPDDLSSFVYFSLANDTTATTATGSNTTLSVTRNADDLAAGTSFEVVLMNGVSTSRGSVEVQAVDVLQATIAGEAERVVLEGTIPVNASLDFEVMDADDTGEDVTLTWSLSELPSTLVGLVYFEPGRGTSTGIETTGSSAKLVVVRGTGFPVPANFDVLLMNDVSVYAPARVGVRVVEEGQPFIAGPDERTVVVGNGVSGFSNLAFEAEDTEPSEESITWTWSLSGLPDDLSSFVYFSLANGTTATTATGSNTTLSVTRNADRLADGAGFEVVLMNGVSTSRGSVEVQAVDVLQATIAGEAERVVLEGTTSVNASLDFEVMDADDTGEDVTLTWSLSELPSTLVGLVYFEPGRGTSTGIETTGSSAKLVVVRGTGFPVPANFDVLLMNDVSVYAPARVGVRVVEEGQPFIAGLDERTVVVGNGVSGFSNLAFEAEDTEPSEESITWTWSLPELPDGLSGLVYFSLANGTTATTATGSNTTLSVTRNANDLVDGAGFEVVLMNGVSTSRASVQVRAVDAAQATIVGDAGRVVLEGTIPVNANLVFEAEDAGYGGESAILTWSLSELPSTLRGLVYFEPGRGTSTGIETTGSSAKLVVVRGTGFPVPANFDVLLTNGVSVYAPARVGVRVVKAGQPVIVDPDPRTVVVGNGVSGFSNLVFAADDAEPSEESITWTWLLAGLPDESSGFVYFSLASGTTATTATGSNTTLSVTRNADRLADGRSFEVVLMNGVSTSRDSVQVQAVNAAQATIAGAAVRVVRVGTVPAESASLDFKVENRGYGEASEILTWSLSELPSSLRGLVYFEPGRATSTGIETIGTSARLIVVRNERLPVPAGFDVLLMNDVSVYAPARVQVRVVEAGQPVIAGLDERTVAVGDDVSGFSNLVFEVADTEPSEESITWTWSLPELPTTLQGFVYFNLANGTTATTATGSNTTLSVTRNADDLAAGAGFEVVLMNDVSASRDSVQVQAVNAAQATIAGSTERVVLEGTIPVAASLDFEVENRGYGEASAILTWSLSELPSSLVGLVHFDSGRGTSTAIEMTGTSAKLVVVRGAGFPVPADFDVLLMNDVSVYAPARVGVRVVEAGQPVIGGLDERTAAVGNGVSGFSNLAFEVVDTEPSEESITWTWSLSGLPDDLSSFVYFSLAGGTTATTATGSNTTLSVTRNADDLADGAGFEVVLMNGVSTSRDSVQVQAVNAAQATIAGSTERVVLEGTIPVAASLDFKVRNAGYGGESANLTWSLSELPSTLRGLVYFDPGRGTSTGIETTGSSAKLVVVRHAGFPVPASFYVLLMNNVSVYAADRVGVRVVEEGQPFIAGPDVRTVVVGNGVSGFSNLVFEVVDAEPSEESITWTWSLSGLPDDLSSFVYFSLAGGTTATGSTVTLSVTRNADRLAVGTSFEVVLMNGVSTSRDSVQVRVVEASPPVIGEGGVFAEDEVLIRTIWEGSTDSTLTVEAIDPGVGDADDLSWSFVSRDDIAPEASVEFSGSTMGVVVELRVTRPLDLYDVGSFVLRVTNSFGAYSTVTVSIVTVCSEDRGRDLMSGQTGAGTSGNPYQIRRLCQLQDVRSSPSAYYELAADIDASPTRNWNDGEGFEPIATGTNSGGGFSGSFVNSSNYVITGLTIDRPSTDNVGLFSRLAEGATIRGVRLMDSRTTGRGNVGGLVGYSEGSVSVSYATGSVTGTGDNVGGLVGYSEGSVSNSYAEGQVMGNENVGGLVGSSTGGTTISYTYSLSTVTGTDPDNFGGLVGNSAGNIDASYFTGSDNSFGEQRTLPQMACPTAADPTCLPTEEGAFTYVGWNQGIWDFGTDSDFPKLRDAFIPITPITDSQKLRIRLYLGGATR